jgi:hypothetical protein
MAFTGEESVVPATIFTGDDTEAPSAGVQIVTDGVTVLRGHGAAKAGKANATNTRENAIRRSFLFMGVP